MSIELMSRVWKSTDFRGTELLILLCLADHANDEGCCWPSYKTIAAKARTSPRWAMRCVKNMEELGYLTRDRGNVGRANTYYLTIPPVRKGGEVSSPPNGAFPAKGVVPSSPTSDVQQHSRGEAQTTRGVVPTSHESSDEPSLKHHESAAEAATVTIEQAFDHILAVTTTNEILAVGLAERWIREGPAAGPDWKAHLTDWLRKSA